MLKLKHFLEIRISFNSLCGLLKLNWHPLLAYYLEFEALNKDFVCAYLNNA